MTTTILVAGNDLDVYQLIRDILEITFKAVNVDRVLDPDKLYERLSDDATLYNLILIDRHFGDQDNVDIIEQIRGRYPQYADRLVAVLDASGKGSGDENLESVPVVVKPFSLDAFAETVRAACRADELPPHE